LRRDFRDARPIPKVAAWPRGSWGVSALGPPVCYRAPSSGSRSDSVVSQPWDDRVWAGLLFGTL
jgi:hypothetical protein